MSCESAAVSAGAARAPTAALAAGARLHDVAAARGDLPVVAALRRAPALVLLRRLLPALLVVVVGELAGVRRLLVVHRHVDVRAGRAAPLHARSAADPV